MRHAVMNNPDSFLLAALPASGAVLATGLGLAEFSGTALGKGKVDGRICAQRSKSTLKLHVV